MKLLTTSLLMVLVLSSCGSSKKVADHSSKSSNHSKNKTVDPIIDHAISFEGTPYRFGGTSKKGMDCSGLIYVSYLEGEIQLPRVSRDMAKTGKKIALADVREGDLVFFSTSKKGGGINHVGLVVERKGGQIRFIHSTTSRGVIVSSMDENYWRKAFVQARKVI
ncbi:C40 family peptidase [Aureitalea marina]|nr:C40 family peptidase [Aureitalea marina]